VKVRDVIKRIEADGWYLVTIKGDHRQFKHAEKKDGLQFQDSWGKKCLPQPTSRAEYIDVSIPA
jgi:HicA toxin of bacterial toxin-antitoxin,